jgi:riboflavin synthase
VFTGLVDDVGEITHVAETAAGREIRITTRYEDLADGESIAINGACLTVLAHGPRWFTVGAVVTTLGRTTIGEWAAGRRVNLERALRVGDRLGGHFVQGHVDGVATVERVEQESDARLVDLALPTGLSDLMVQHGSLAVDGVSLTVNDLPAESSRAQRGICSSRVQLSLIDYTLRHTTLGGLVAGDRVHIEADMLGKYVQRLLKESTWSLER